MKYNYISLFIIISSFFLGAVIYSIFCLTRGKLHDTLILTPHARALSQAKHRQALTEVAIYHKVRMLETLRLQLSLTLVISIKEVGE